ncbi:hypothetical protein GQR58_002025 [Nymphon striatum]|nr:hypothetical protein GQR58_002025 [Nymphon striatum]
MASKKPQPLKRTRSQSDIGSLNLNKKFNKNDITYNCIKPTTDATTPWPRFLVIKSNTADKSEPLAKLSPFAIHKTIISIAGEPKSVKKLFSGDILVETTTKNHTDRLMKSKSFFNIPVTVSPHSSLNYSKGVIRSRELKDCSETELLQELESQGITSVKKISITKNGKRITTGTIILTFNSPEPPKAIKAAYLNSKWDGEINNKLHAIKPKLGEWALAYRKSRKEEEKLSLQYACRLRANPENPCYDVTFHPNHRETFARRQNSIPTFGLRVLPLFEQIGLPLGNIARCVLPSIPPWTMHRPIINFSLTGLKKGTTPSYVYLYKFLEVSDSYHGYHHIYTDGSRQNDEVAAAAISTLTSLSSRLPDKSSIFSAESKALLLALDIVENSTYGRYIILSDSLSCLMALDNMKYSHPTICDILVKLHLLTKSNHVIFCWLPSHVGISGNEKADFAAKSALSLPVDPQLYSYHDFYMYIFKHILSIWQSKWDGEINNKLHAIKPKLGEWALAYRKSRKKSPFCVAYALGHTYLTHSFLLRNEAQPVCGRCQQPLTVRHVLVDCVALTSVRSRFYSPLPWEEFFEEVDLCKLFKFLKYLNVYNRM